MMLIRKQDIDPQIVIRLPDSVFATSFDWLQGAVIAGIACLGGALATLSLFTPASKDVIVFLACSAIVTSFMASVGAVLAITRYRDTQATVVPSALRKFAKKRKALDIVEREYCQLVATLGESSAIADDTAHTMLADANTLLAAYRLLDDQKLPAIVRAARQESTRQTFRALRKSLKQVGEALADHVASPVALAVATVDDTTQRLNAHVRSLEQATSEVQSLRH